jgi:hypothetical protein
MWRMYPQFIDPSCQGLLTAISYLIPVSAGSQLACRGTLNSSHSDRSLLASRCYMPLGPNYRQLWMVITTASWDNDWSDQSIDIFPIDDQSLKGTENRSGIKTAHGRLFRWMGNWSYWRDSRRPTYAVRRRLLVCRRFQRQNFSNYPFPSFSFYQILTVMFSVQSFTNLS